MNKPKKNTRITVNLLDNEYVELTALAEQHDVSLSRITRQAIVGFLERHGTGESQIPLKFRSANR